MRAALLVALLVVGGCFSPDQPVCAFQCGDGQLCPDNYFCATDNYCHLNGHNEACPFPDASAPVPDLMSMPDGGGMPDLAMPDLAMPDLAMPDLAMPDLSTSD